jgi:flagellar biosynthesis chaperone FliJ
MKTMRPSQATRALREQKPGLKQTCQSALRACEAAAAKVQEASSELATSWTALCHEISTGVSSTDILRKRAWCNVLELRLKEQAQALEQARHGVDLVWEDLMLSARARELFSRLLKKNDNEASANPDSLPLLARTASAIAAAHRRAAPLKKSI